MNIWGYCERCDRWFGCPTDRATEWACPSCGMEPLRIENRILNGATVADNGQGSQTSE